MLWVATCSLALATAEIAILAWLDAKLMEKVQQWFVLYHVPFVAVSCSCSSSTLKLILISVSCTTTTSSFVGFIYA